MSEEETNQQEQYSSMVNSNSILLSFEGWIKYIEGFVRGLQTTEKVNSSVVMSCIGEILEFMTQLRLQIQNILLHCEDILEENEKITKENEELKAKLNIPLLEKKEVENG
jgi:hypothetical protein